MKFDLSTIIRELQQEKGISEDLIMNTVETAITKAFEKYYGTTENLVIRRDDELVLSVFAKKEVVKNVDDDLFEISIDEAKAINSEAEEGDLMLVPCNPEDFGRIAIHSAKQIILQRLRELKKNNIFSEFKDKQGELIIGYIQRIRDDNIYIDLGNYEGVLPKKNQAPHEHYQQGDRIKTIIDEVKKTKKGNITIILSRTSPDFIKRLFEVEIPEIYDNEIQIHKIVREPGYRTKVAVYSNKEEIDPVGACVGQKGNRIVNIIKELEGEKIDVLKYTIDAKAFISNAMIPAKVDSVIITDEANKKAIAIVDESQLSFAIGKKGLNIKLANALTDWNIDVKTTEQAIEMKLIEDHMQKAEDLFKEDISKNEIDGLELPYQIKDILKNNNITTIEQMVELTYDDIIKLNGITEELSLTLKKYIDENFEIVIEENDEEEVIEDKKVQDGIVYYECPNCGGKIPDNATACPSCGVEISFEEDDDNEDEDAEVNGED
jgi:N utilization substance protein A